METRRAVRARLSSPDFPCLPNVLVKCPAALLIFFDTIGALKLRLVCSSAKEAVEAHPWRDEETRINGRPQDWRACFPYARAANFRGSTVFTTEHFPLLAGLLSLNVSECPHLSNAAFPYLRGIQKLEMGECRQITDAAFIHLRGIKELDMRNCNQATITDAALDHLAGIRKLRMFGCRPALIASAQQRGSPVDLSEY